MDKSTDDIKKIISFFLGADAGSITEATIIDNSVMQGSVKIHMMYGNLADNGYKVSDYSTIRTFGELLSRLNLSGDQNGDLKKGPSSAETGEVASPANEAVQFERSAQSESICVGVDILRISKLPKTDDFRESSFYTDNFSLKEFTYCLIKPDPYRAFAGKFAAKEAVVKANNDYKNRPFKEIEIINDSNGKPVFDNFAISISYEDDLAIATAACYKKPAEGDKLPDSEATSAKRMAGMEQKIEKMKHDLGSYFLKKSNRRLILFSLILNIVTIVYLTGKAIDLF